MIRGRALPEDIRAYLASRPVRAETEAIRIALELAGVKFARPLTHDLLKQLIVGLGARLNRVLITQVKASSM